jgi:hypothetical protein
MVSVEANSRQHNPKKVARWNFRTPDDSWRAPLAPCSAEGLNTDRVWHGSLTDKQKRGPRIQILSPMEARPERLIEK